MTTTATLDKTTKSTTNGNARYPKAVADIAQERVVVTPELAKAWLDKNIHNRKAVGNHVAKLARDMKAGRFAFTGDAIRFDSDGRLIDGQHRLLACIKAEASFESNVIYNLPPATQDVIDAGRPRAASDLLSMEGFHNASTLASAVRLLIAEKAGFSHVRATTFTNSEIIAFRGHHPGLPSSVNVCRKAKLPKGISGSHVAAIHYVGTHLLNLPATADDFFGVLAWGVPTYDGDAAHVYRERIIKQTAGSMESKREDKWRMIKHAWNLFAAKKPVKIIKPGDTVTFEGLDYKLL